MSAQVPDAPGWWWREIRGRAEVVRVWASPIVEGRLDTTGDTPVSEIVGWLGPVAPPGSVPAPTHAREIREAWEAGHRAGYDAARSPGATGRSGWAADMWAWSDTRALLQRRYPDALAAVERGEA